MSVRKADQANDTPDNTPAEDGIAVPALAEAREKGYLGTVPDGDRGPQTFAENAAALKKSE